MVEKVEEALPAVVPSEEVTLTPTPGMLAITGAAIGTAYKERPLTMGVLTAFILLIAGLFIYSHTKDLKHWPFHFKFKKKRYILLVIIVLIVFILLFIHSILLIYFRSV